MKCIICNEEIYGRYLMDYWHQMIHDFHKVDYCFSCGRFVRPCDVRLTDGRCICAFCSTNVVKTPQHINWVETRVRHILKVNGIADIPRSIPVEIITASRMAELCHSSIVDMNQYGLTQTSQMFNSFITHCSHTIYILDFLPKIFFAGVLAHELLHAWQNEHGISLPPLYSEGFCNLGSYVVYRMIDIDLSQYYIKRLDEDKSPVYGEGYRKVKTVYEKEGDLLQTILFLNKKRK